MSLPIKATHLTTASSFWLEIHHVQYVHSCINSMHQCLPIPYQRPLFPFLSINLQRNAPLLKLKDNIDQNSDEKRRTKDCRADAVMIPDSFPISDSVDAVQIHANGVE